MTMNRREVFLGAIVAMESAELALQHKKSDVDQSPLSQHHTLGPGPNQAAPGNHTHDGSSSKTAVPVYGYNSNRVQLLVAGTVYDLVSITFSQIGVYKIDFSTFLYCMDLSGDNDMITCDNYTKVANPDGSVDPVRVCSAQGVASSVSSELYLHTNNVILTGLGHCLVKESVILKVLEPVTLTWSASAATTSGRIEHYVSSLVATPLFSAK